MSGTTFASILFVCTGNYYRSRFAEILFNQRTRELRLPASAFSRGFRLSDNNKGHISPYTLRRLSVLGIDPGISRRFPLAITESDIASADRTIALDEEEHRPFAERMFSELKSEFEYWNVHDLHIDASDIALPQIELKIEELVLEMSRRSEPVRA